MYNGVSKSEWNTATISEHVQSQSTKIYLLINTQVTVGVCVLVCVRLCVCLCVCVWLGGSVEGAAAHILRARRSVFSVVF